MILHPGLCRCIAERKIQTRPYDFRCNRVRGSFFPLNSKPLILLTFSSQGIQIAGLLAMTRGFLP